MPDKLSERFDGFQPETLTFLKNLEANNTRAWFEAHRGEYQEHLLRPFQLLSASPAFRPMRLSNWTPSSRSVPEWR